MPTRKSLLGMTSAAALCLAPVLALGQANTGGSSQMQGTTQNAPQSGAQGYNANPAGSAQGEGLSTTGGRMAAPGAQGAAPGGTPGPDQSQLDRIRQGQGNTTGNDARPGAAPGNAPGNTPGSPPAPPSGNTQNPAQGGAANTPRDGTQGNPPSTATARAADSVTGNRTDADGTGNNPPGTAAGRAAERGTSAVTNAPVGDNLGSAPANRADGGAPGQNRPSGAAPTGAAATGATTGAMAVDSSRTQGGRRASRVIGSTVYNENNETIGEVDDLVLSGTGQPVAVISVGGFLGIGARLVAVPYERLQQGERDRWTLPGATRDSLQSLPAFNYEDGSRRG